MKIITIGFILSLIASINSFAAVNHNQAMKLFRGQYKFIDHQHQEEVIFKISRAGAILLNVDDSTSYYEARTQVSSLGNGLGPDGLTVMTIILSGGSDEQTTTLLIRIYPKQEQGSTTTGLLDIVYLENDGPNKVTWASPTSKTKLYKRRSSKSHQFIEVKRF